MQKSTDMVDACVLKFAMKSDEFKPQSVYFDYRYSFPHWKIKIKTTHLFTYEKYEATYSKENWPTYPVDRDLSFLLIKKYFDIS